MKKTLTLVFIFSFLLANSQSWNNQPGTFSRPSGMWPLTVLKLPSDTVTNKTGLAQIGQVIYFGNGTYWQEVKVSPITVDWQEIFGKPIYFPTNYDSSGNIKDSLQARELLSNKVDIIGTPNSTNYLSTAGVNGFVASSIAGKADTNSYKVTTLYQIGDIYNKSSWTDLSDFNTNAGYTVASGKINATGDNSHTNYLQINKASALDKYSVSATFKYTTSVPTSDSGFRVGMNGDFASCYAYIRVSDRRLYGIMSYGDVKYPSDSVFSSLSVGDSIYLQMSWDRGTPTVTATNFTTGQTISQVLPSIFVAALGMQANTAYPTIRAGAATYQICSFRYTSSGFSQPVLAIGGNSITRGASANAWNLRYATQVGALVWAGSGDETSDMLLRLPELRDYIKPKNLFLMIGGNDVASSIDSNITKVNYQKIVDSATSYGINVYHLLPTPRTATDLTWFKNYIVRTFPTKHIDTWTPLLGTGSNMAAWFNSGDNIHPNQLGHNAIANRIKADTIYQRLVKEYGYNNVLDQYNVTAKSTTDTTPLATKTYVDLKLETLNNSTTTISGTLNTVPKFGTTGLTNSQITDNGSTVTIRGTNILGGYIQLESDSTGIISWNFNNNKKGAFTLWMGSGTKQFEVDSLGNVMIRLGLTTGYGTFSGAVSAVGLSSTTGSFSGAVGTGNLTVTGQATVSNSLTALTLQATGSTITPIISGLSTVNAHTVTGSGKVLTVASTGGSSDNYINIVGQSGGWDVTARNSAAGNVFGIARAGVRYMFTLDPTSGQPYFYSFSTLALRGLIVSDSLGFLSKLTGNANQFITLGVNGIPQASSSIKDFHVLARLRTSSLMLNKDSVAFATSASKLMLIDTVTGLLTRVNIGSTLSLANGTLNAIGNVIGGSATATVTAVTTFVVSPGTQANNTYQVAITPSNALSAALYYVTNKTTTSFDVVFADPLTGTVAFDWILKP